MQHSLVSNGLIALYASTDLALQDDTPSFVAAYRGVATENICWHAGDHRQQERAGSDGISHTGGGERLQNARLVAVWVAIAFGMALYYLSRTRSGTHTIHLMAGIAGVMSSTPMSQLNRKGLTTEQRPPFAINCGKQGKIIGEEHPYFKVNSKVAEATKEASINYQKKRGKDKE